MAYLMKKINSIYSRYRLIKLKNDISEFTKDARFIPFKAYSKFQNNFII